MTATATASVDLAAAAQAKVRAFYTAYNVGPDSPGYDAQKIAAEYVSPALLPKLFHPSQPGDRDEVLCAQNNSTSVTVDPATISGDHATVRVTTFADLGAITVTLSVPDLVVTGIACPAP
jgi:hypothetical protein